MNTTSPLPRRSKIADITLSEISQTSSHNLQSKKVTEAESMLVATNGQGGGGNGEILAKGYKVVGDAG